MSRNFRFWLGLFILVLAAPACSLLPEASAPGIASAETKVLYADGFSDPNSGWSSWKDESSTVAYEDGRLHIRVDRPHYDSWSRPGKRFADTHIEVDVLEANGTEDNDFGIICRYRTGDNFYAMLASSDGYYGIVKMEDGQYSVLSGDQMQYSPAIARGSVENHVRADCVGSTLSMYVNNQLLAQVEDSTFQSGEVGLIAGAYDVPGVEISFDNFIVLKP